MTALGILGGLGIVLAIIVVIALLWGVGAYNGFIKLRNLVQESWQQVDVELQRRYDLIPNLIETVKGYLTHEKTVLEEVTAARAAVMGSHASPAGRAQGEEVLSSALGRLFAVAENYPQLRASEAFVSLQAELANTEDRIAAARRFYNANVRTLNTKVESFPSNIIAGIFKFVRAEYFEISDPVARQAPQVKF